MIHVMDASALLAVSKGEAGFDVVMEILRTQDCVISSVNMAEVATRLLDMGLPERELERGGFQRLAGSGAADHSAGLRCGHTV